MTDQAAAPDAVHALESFFARLKDQDRAWLAMCCVFKLADEIEPIKNGEEATIWVHRFLTEPRRPEQRFGRLVCLSALIDFELSPFALSRFAARAQGMTRATDAYVAQEGQRMLRRCSELQAIGDAWREARTNELDEAALWIYRDEMQHLGVEELGRQLRSIRRGEEPGEGTP